MPLHHGVLALRVTTTGAGDELFHTPDELVILGVWCIIEQAASTGTAWPPNRVDHRTARPRPSASSHGTPKAQTGFALAASTPYGAQDRSRGSYGPGGHLIRPTRPSFLSVERARRGKRARRHQGNPPTRPQKTASHEKEEIPRAQTIEPQLADILDYGVIAESFLLLSRGGSLRVVPACADCGLDQLVHAQVSRQSAQTVAVPCEPAS